MKKVISQLNVIFTNAVIHAVKIGRSEGNEVLPFLTSLAAIIYILSSTLGSGSYKEMLSFTAVVYQVTMAVVLFFIQLVFSVTLVAYLDGVLKLIDLKTSLKYNFRLFPGKHLPLVSVIGIMPAILIFLYSMQRGGWTDVPSEQEAKIFFFSVFFLLSVWFIAFLERVVMGNEPLLFYIFLLIVLFCSLAVTYNIYRDSYKYSFNINNQYCYWSSSSFEYNTDKSRSSISKTDRNMCEALQDRNVEFRFIRSRSFDG